MASDFPHFNDSFLNRLLSQIGVFFVSKLIPWNSHVLLSEIFIWLKTSMPDCVMIRKASSGEREPSCVTLRLEPSPLPS